FYVLDNENILPIAPAERSYDTKTKTERFLICFAGPAMNFILAFILYFSLCFGVLKPDLKGTTISSIDSSFSLGSLLKEGDKIVSINGISISKWEDISKATKSADSLKFSIEYIREDHKEELVGEFAYINQMIGLTNQKEDGTFFAYTDIVKIENLNKNSKLNSSASLKNEDVIIGLKQESSGEFTDITNWNDLFLFFKNNDGGNLNVKYIRLGETKEAKLQSYTKEILEKMDVSPYQLMIGISPISKFNFLYSITYPFRAMYADISQMFATLGLLFSKNEIGIFDLSGPVGIYNLVSQATSRSLTSLIGLVAFISINLGFINLLPIPALDGGRILFIGIEAITKKRVPKKIENIAIMITYVLLLGLMLVVTIGDISRFFLTFL
ncbi:MAG: RIP metalloprotease RseP, partial [Acholeplasmatales bacterium]|nr:RIP metalloprotease RseP [Acholeplasmatales bacterium]